MFIKTLNVVANITFLVVSCMFLVILMTNDNSQASGNDVMSQVQRLMDKNIQYVEGRINRIQASQDSYQLTASHRLDVLEIKIRSLESENKALKAQNRSINTNTISVTQSR